MGMGTAMGTGIGIKARNWRLRLRTIRTFPHPFRMREFFLPVLYWLEAIGEVSGSVLRQLRRGNIGYGQLLPVLRGRAAGQTAYRCRGIRA